MIEIENMLLINTGVSSVVLFVLFILWMVKPTEKKEERVYLSKEMHKIKENINDSEVDI